MFIMLLGLLLPLKGNGQTISNINIPTDICAGGQMNISFGYNSEYNIVVDTFSTYIMRSDRAFLPDGIPCNSRCSYSAPITFEGFDANATLTSVNDIEYVRINMEHSYIGDIYIGLTCPNGTSVSIMNWRDIGHSQCTDSVPSTRRGWNTSYSNTTPGTYFGLAYDHTGSPKCDSSASGNQPGIGWNYCWSNNTASGYSYAAQDALIYRNANSIYVGMNRVVDSSNVSAGSNFYHPEQSFSNLAGCPLNGQWTIDVIDAFSQDNGYIFEWELGLNSTLRPAQCAVEEQIIVSPYVTQLSDTSFLFVAPSGITSDTTVILNILLVNSCGDTIDTLAPVHIHPNYSQSETAIACDSYTWHGVTFTADTLFDTLLHTTHSCDSLLTLNLTVNHSTANTVDDTVVENSLPYSYADSTISPDTPSSTYQFTFTNSVGCDSLVTLNLTVWFNVRTDIDSTLCQHQLPMLWNGVNVDSEDNWSATMSTTNGADSLVTLHLTVLPDKDTAIFDTVVQNQLPVTFAGVTFASAVTDSPLLLTATNGCDSTIHYNLHVWPNVSVDLDTAICINHFPYRWNDTLFTEPDTIVFIRLDKNGADSTVTLGISALPVYDITVFDTIVQNQLPYTYNGMVFSSLEPTEQQFDLTSAPGCDSTVHYNLYVWPNIAESYDTAVCDNMLPYSWNNHTFTESGTAVLNLFTTNGADSTVTLTLSLLPTYDIGIYDTVVENQLPVTYDGRTINSAGVEVFNYSTQHGCDSIIRYNLYVWANVSQTFDTAICENMFPFMWHNQQFTTSDTIVQNLHTINGADSTVTLILGTLPIYDTTVMIDLCIGSTYWLGNRPITDSGTYNAHLYTLAGCDSLVTATITLRPTYHYHYYDTTCRTSAYLFDGTYYRHSGTYDHMHSTAVYGCDSLLTLHLELKGVNLEARAHITPTIVTPEDLKVTLQDRSRAAIDRQWTLEDFVTNQPKFEYTYPEELDSVDAMLVAFSDDGCTDTVVTTLRIDRARIFAPNTFTPNQPTNDRWYLVGQQIATLEVWIYNRQGNLVYHYDTPDGSWDGTMSDGTPCPQAAYVYRASYTTLLYPDRQQSITGTILLLR